MVTVTDDVALAEAALADAELARGLDRGPLHGIPYGAKDILATARHPDHLGRRAVPRAGAGPRRHRRPRGCATPARCSRPSSPPSRSPAAWATTTPTPASPARPSTRGTPTPGSAARRAARRPPSPRAWCRSPSARTPAGRSCSPAAWTGLAGLRATYGRVSRFGAMTLCWTLDRLGPMCRTADDCSLVLEAIAGHDPNDPASVAAPPYRHASASRKRRLPLRRGARRRRGRRARDRRALRAHPRPAAGARHGRGARPPGPARTTPSRTSLLGAEAAAAFDDFIAAGRTQELTATKAAGHRLDGLAFCRRSTTSAAQRLRRKIATAFDELASRYDALVAPTLGTTASGVREDFEYMLRSAFPVPLNVAGVLSGTPTISLPNGLGRDGLPTAAGAGRRRGSARPGSWRPRWPSRPGSASPSCARRRRIGPAREAAPA